MVYVNLIIEIVYVVRLEHDTNKLKDKLIKHNIRIEFYRKINAIVHNTIFDPCRNFEIRIKKRIV